MTESQVQALQEVKASVELCILPKQAAAVLAMDPHTIRCQAQQAPEKLGFPVIVTGHRVKIPRIAFLHFLGEG